MSTGAPFYITTPIYYVNDRPHIGHCYTTIVADCVARSMRQMGRDVFFLTGTDEHGQKVEKSAVAKGVSPQELADENAAHFQAARFIGSSNDDFIRTTEPRHQKQVQAALTRLIGSGDVYLGTFEGWYDEGQEEYITENQAREKSYKAFNGTPLVRAKEQNYYFRLSAYQARLEELYTRHPDFIRPEARRNEILGRLRAPEGLQDVPVSRTNFSWGIPVPVPPADDGSKHITYVWIDALLNYVTAVGGIDLEAMPATQRDRAKYWPAQYHVIGKEILWFHAVIWPATLMALGLETPRCVYAHSFWVRDGRKMSKTLGNFVDLETIEAYCAAFGRDAYRWYMLTQGPLGASDADFAHNKFVEVYNADLANGIGNAASRVSNMIDKYFGGRCPDPKGVTVHAGHDWPAITSAAAESAATKMAALDVAGSLTEALGISRRVDGYIHATEPFKMAKDPAKMEQVGAILYHCAEALRISSWLMRPAMPDKMNDVLSRLGASMDASASFAEVTAWGGLKPGTVITKGEALFPRADPEAAAPAANGE